MKVGVFVGFSRIFLLGILISKGLTARSLYMSFGVKEVICFRYQRDDDSMGSKRVAE
jgi:hypothetical protein